VFVITPIAKMDMKNIIAPARANNKYFGIE
jgi:hypothetical protein